jgi:polysaccharide export outer membrane protein
MKYSALLLLLAGTIGISQAQVQPLHKIRSNDLVSVAIYGEPDLTRTVRVGSDGTLRLPLLEQKVKADGLMPEQLEKAIADAFEAEQILVNPFVTVTVAEYHTLLPVSVAGAVRNPITFETTGKVTLLEAITRAGGLTPEAGPEILISRPSQDSSTPDSSTPDSSPQNPSAQPAPLVQRILVRALIDAADPAVNLVLQGGEEIRVPEAGKIFVVGNVKIPGAFSVHDGAELTVLKALALTQGLAPYASNQAYIYRREVGSGSPNEIPVDLHEIMQRKSPDVPLFANDILYIPDRAGKRATMSILEKVFGVGAGLSAALLYMH